MVEVVVGLGIAQGALAVVHLGSGIAVGGQGEVQVLPLEAQVDAIDEVGQIGTQGGAVLAVNDAVTVQVFVLEVTRLQAVGLGGPVIGTFLLGLVDTFHDIAIERVHLLADKLIGLAAGDVGVTGQVLHLVLEVGQIGADIVLEVVTHTVGPVNAHIDTGVEDLTDVLQQRAVLEGQTRSDNGLAGHAVEPVDIHA